MCNKEQLVGYLYGELPAAEIAAFEAHLAGCAGCRAEVGQLRQTRQHLEAWSPPEPEFDFQIVQTRAARATAKRFGGIPQWAIAAAASLFVVAGAAAVAHVEVRYQPDGSVVVRTGWASSPAAATDGATASTARPAGAAPQAVASTAASEQLERQVLALIKRVSELEANQPAPGARAAGATRPGISAPELRKILAESEARQRAEIGVYVQQIWKDFNAARTSDLARVQQALGQAQGLTNIQLRQQRDSIESLRFLHAASQQK